MTIEGTAFRNCHPCAVCMDEGEQVWLRSTDNLCYYCRKENMPKSTGTAMVPANAYEKEIASHTEVVNDLLSDDFRKYVIQTPEDYKEVGDIINDLKNRAKDVDAVKKTATAPMRESLQVISSWFKNIEDGLTRARDLADGKIRTYLRTQAAAQAEVQKALQAAAKAGNTEVVRTELAKLENKPSVQGVTIINGWVWKVRNIDIVPDGFTTKVADTTAIEAEMKRQIKEGAEAPTIAGIEFTQTQQVKATGRG